MPQKQIFILAGPSGSGETTLTNELVLAYPNITRAVTATTRPPREGEKDGEDYHFFSKERFFEEVQQGTIPEYTYVEMRDAHYGSYQPDIDKKLAEGKIVVVNTDLKGAQYYKKQYGATTIFIKPKSLDVLRDRIARRNPALSENDVNIRMLQALKEIVDAIDQYDYVVFNTDGEFDKTIVAIVDALKRGGYPIE